MRVVLFFLAFLIGAAGAIGLDVADRSAHPQAQHRIAVHTSAP